MAKNNKYQGAIQIITLFGFVIVVIIIFFFACFVFKAQCGIDILSKFSKPKVTPVITIAPTEGVKLISVAYKGTLPCADCPGLDTELILKKVNEDSTNGTYVTKETYLEKNVSPVITEGTWKTIFGSIKGKPETILELNPGNLDNIRYFIKVDDSELKMLDKNNVELVGSPSISLKKINN